MNYKIPNLKDITNKIQQIDASLTDIVQVMQIYYPDLQPNQLGEIAGKIQALVYYKQSGVSYLKDTVVDKNNIIMQFSCYKGVEDYIDFNTTVTKGYSTYVTTIGGTTISSSTNKNYNFSTTAITDSNFEPNEEGWVAGNIKVKSNALENLIINNCDNLIAIKGKLSDSSTDLSYSFKQNKNLRTVDVVIPENTRLQDTFAGCTGLCGVTINFNNAQYCVRTFAGCTGLRTIEMDLSNCVETTDMFSGCTNLQNITISKECTKIPDIDISPCKNMTTSDVIRFLKTIPVGDANMKKTITIPSDLLSSAQKSSFINSKNINIVEKR